MSVFDLNYLSSFETPFYYYDLDLLRKTIASLLNSNVKYGFHVHYAMKANPDDKVISVIKENGLGADCVSGNEVKKALEFGFSRDKIVFAGVGKSDKEINIALKNDIFCFNCESAQELNVINSLAAQQNKKACVALRINPNVNANTHRYITTGLEENKFGINSWELTEVLELLKTLPNIELTGLHFHIGSQINDYDSFKNLCLRTNELQHWFAERSVKITHLNMGGGLGVDYHYPDKNAIPDFDKYFAIFQQFLERKPHQEVHFELGRSIVAQCGNLISRVLFIKKAVNTTFMILDAGMTELIRPALYQSFHKIENLNNTVSVASDLIKYDVVGPICESSDCFAKSLLLPETKRGDMIVIRTAGAYGEVMSSQYNLRDKAMAVYSE